MFQRQIYPIVYAFVLLAKPIQKHESVNGKHLPSVPPDRGVRLVVRILGSVAWYSAFLHWAGMAGLFIKPAITDEAIYGRHNELLSPAITSFLNGDWKWSSPDAAQFKGGPIFFMLDYTSSTLAVWASQIESGHPPSIGQAIVGGPACAIARSMAETWSAAL